jgi:DNA-binding SARP family transcriptional activator
MLQTPWRIELLGGLRVRRGDRVVERFRTYKTGALLAYATYHAPRLYSREALLGLFWPEMEPEAARHNLRQTLSTLRHELAALEASEEDLVVADRVHLWLQPGVFTTDVADLQAALQAAQYAPTSAERIMALSRAVALYQGELLPGYFEDWADAERARLADSHLEVLRQLAQDAEQAGDLQQSLHFARRILYFDPLDENAHCHLIRLYAATGRPIAAQNQYQEMERLFKTELDTVPSSQASALAKQALSSAAVQPVRAVPDSGAAPQRKEWPTPGGALLPDSPLYILRQTDQELREALACQESVILIKGARQIGKTSLLARGLHQVRAQGISVALTDLQKLNADSLISLPTFYQALGDSLARRFRLPTTLTERWKAQHSANTNFENYLLDDVLPALPGALVWAFDEIDRLFTCDFGSEVFGLLRSWHNERALDPISPWSHLSLAMAYATEVTLFITDLNQSPFNVGLRLELQDFTCEQVAQLNHVYGAPLRDESAVNRFYALVGGLPYVVQRGLYALATQQIDFETFARQADQDEGPLGDYLRRLLVSLLQNSALAETVRYVLQDQPCPSVESFYRLRSAGILIGPTYKQAQLRSRLTAQYLERHLL